MAKKKKVSSTELISRYMENVVAHSERPLSVEDFATSEGFDAETFYMHFDSLRALEKEIFKLLFDNSLEVMAQSQEYANFSKKDKLISLYFTFFENLTLNREYILVTLNGFENQLKALSTLSLLKKNFTAFVDTLDLDTLDLKVNSLESIQKKTIRESAWVQLLFIMKFWLDDDSPEFEKTDVLIEKSLNTGLELLDTKSLQNIIDLGKFLYKEKFRPSH